MEEIEMSKSEILVKHENIKNIVRKNIFLINPIFASILYKLYWRIDFNCPKHGYAYIAHNKENTDDIAGNSIFFAPDLFKNPKFNDKNYIFILLHEILHKISGHNSRRGTRDSSLWNLACDHTINLLLKKIDKENNFIKNIKPVDQIDPETNKVIDGWKTVFIDESLEDKNLNAEEVYEYLAKDKQRFTIKPISGPESDQNIEGNKENKQGQDSNNNWIEITDNKTGRKIIINDRKISDDDIINEENIRAESRERIRQRGLQSGYLKTYLDEVLKVELPWTQILKNAIKKYSIMLPCRRTWVRPNKKYFAHNHTLPGITSVSQTDAVGTCVIGIDTSGSISDDDLMKFASIIQDSFTYFKKIIFITHDVEIHQYEEFDQDNLSQFNNFIKTIGFEGRGGTSHKYLFDKIEELYKDQFNTISLFMSLTDGYSDIESLWYNYSWSSNNKIPTYFIITHDGKILNQFDYTYDITNQKNPRQIKIK